jgi:glycosyltransferase involved in cell wall biosynthesis
MTYPIQNFVLIDTSLTSQSGHSLNYDYAIKRECEQQNIPFRMLGSKKAAKVVVEQMQIEPIFSHALQDMHPATSAQYGQYNFLVLNTQFFTDLCLGYGQPAATDLIFIPTTNFTNLFGLYLWLTTLPPESVPRVKICLRNSNFENWLFKLSMQLLQNIPSVNFVTDSVLLKNLHIQAGISRIYEIPIPHAIYPQRETIRIPQDQVASLSALIKGKTPRTKIIGIFGEARHDKGYHLLPIILQLALQKSDDVLFLIKTTTTVGGNSVRRDLIDAATTALATMQPRVAFVDCPVDEETYSALMDLCDAIFLPYSPEIYHSGTSGVFCEAVALAKPVILPRGTWMHYEAERRNIGFLTCQFDVSQFAETIADLALHFDRLKLLSIASQKPFVTDNNSTQLLRSLFDTQV